MGLTKILFLLVSLSTMNSTYASYFLAEKLPGGEAIIAQEVQRDGHYLNLKVDVRGKLYSICRYESSGMERILCKDPRRPHSWVRSEVLGMFAKKGAAISSGGKVEIVECMNKVVFKNLSCASEPY